jgi:hypothetical protein
VDMGLSGLMRWPERLAPHGRQGEGEVEAAVRAERAGGGAVCRQ